jgi:hypothetical protein
MQPVKDGWETPQRRAACVKFKFVTQRQEVPYLLDMHGKHHCLSVPFVPRARRYRNG